MDKTSRLKRFVIIFFAIILLFLVIKALYDYWNSGTLTIKIDGDNPTIVINNDQSKEIAKIDNNEANKRLPAGDYIVEARTKEGGKSYATATVKARQNTSSRLRVNKLFSAQQAARMPTSGINEASSGVYFLQSNARLIKLFNESSLKQPTIKTSLQNVSKIDLDKVGVGFAIASSHLVYSVNGNKTENIRETLLSSVSTLGSPRDIDYDTTTGELFISAGKNVYYAKKGSQQAELLYSAPWPISKIAYSGSGKLFLSQYPEIIDENNEESGDPVVENYAVTILDTKTKQLSEIDKAPYVQSVDWSPNGKSLSFSIGNTLKIYEVASNRFTDNIYLDSILPTQTNWCSDDKLIYNDGTGVWSYKTGQDDQFSSLLSKLSNVSALSCDENENIYSGTFKQPRSGGLYKLALLDDADKALTKKLNSATPYFGKKFVLDYVQSTGKPTVTVRLFTPRDLMGLKRGQKGYLSAYVFSRQAKKEAKDYLSSIGIDAGQVKIVYLTD